MRVAVFSDVHGNRFALEAVLREIGAENPDLTLNLGDQVWGAADPAGAYRLQRDSGALAVRGNTDEFLSLPGERLGENAELAQWLRGQLPPDAPARLMGLPAVAQAAGGAVVASHGSLDNPSEALMLSAGSRPATPAELLERAAAYPDARVFVVGHTHTEMIAAREGKTFVNAGSVSRQFHGDPHARWVLLEERRGCWSAAFRRAPYDAEAAALWALAHSPVGAREAHLLRAGKIPG